MQRDDNNTCYVGTTRYLGQTEVCDLCRCTFSLFEVYYNGRFWLCPECLYQWRMGWHPLQLV